MKQKVVPLMTVVLDSKDLAKIDEEFHAESKIWQPLTGGEKSITAADFTGVRSVRINKFDGFADATTYVRNGANVRYNVTLFQNSTVYAVASVNAPHLKKIGRGTLCVILISRSHFLTAKSVQNLVTLSVLVALLLMY